MRTLVFDQFEFPRWGSEEHLAIALARGREPAARSVTAFVGAAVGVDALQVMPAPVPFDENLGYRLVRPYLADFAGVALPVPCAWPTLAFQDGQGECELVMSAPDLLVYYHWETSA